VIIHAPVRAASGDRTEIARVRDAVRSLIERSLGA